MSRHHPEPCDFPVAPLLPFVRARYADSTTERSRFRPAHDPRIGAGVTALRREFHLSGHTAGRWVAHGLTFYEADRAAGEFGLTIHDLWGDLVAAVDLADEIVAVVVARDRARLERWVHAHVRRLQLAG